MPNSMVEHAYSPRLPEDREGRPRYVYKFQAGLGNIPGRKRERQAGESFKVGE